MFVVVTIADNVVGNILGNMNVQEFPTFEKAQEVAEHQKELGGRSVQLLTAEDYDQWVEELQTPDGYDQDPITL